MNASVISCAVYVYMIAFILIQSKTIITILVKYWHALYVSGFAEQFCNTHADNWLWLHNTVTVPFYLWVRIQKVVTVSVGIKQKCVAHQFCDVIFKKVMYNWIQTDFSRSDFHGKKIKKICLGKTEYLISLSVCLFSCMH